MAVCLDGKAYLVQLEAGFPTARWKYMGTYHLISPNSIMNYGGSRIYILARTLSPVFYCILDK